MKRRKDLLAYTYTDTLYRILAHLLFWALMFAGGYYFNTISFNAVNGTPAAYLLALKQLAVMAFVFYTLLYFILPWFAQKKSWLTGILLLLVAVGAAAVLDAWGDTQIFGRCGTCSQRLEEASPGYHRFLQGDLLSIVQARLLSGGFLYQLILQLSFPAAIKFARNNFRKTVQTLQLARDNLQLEFNFLKAQVNPHFLFNTLNNVYSLVVNDRKEQAAATVARLSGFMRYALYETGDEMVSLEKEVRLLEDYTELEKLRLNETEVAFRFETDGKDYRVPPLLLMPALENAFKYSVDKKDSKIAVNIKALNHTLTVNVQNDLDEKRSTAGGGIGLQNLQKRLRHYYGDKSSYSATAANNVYLFRLTCPLA